MLPAIFTHSTVSESAARTAHRKSTASASQGGKRGVRLVEREQDGPDRDERSRRRILRPKPLAQPWWR